MKKIFLLCLLLGVSVFGFFGIAGTAHAELYTYEYHLQTYAQANSIRDLFIQLTDGVIGADITNIVATPPATYSIGTFTSSDLPGLPATMYGINFTVPLNAGSHNFSIKFDTPNAPVWGSAFARGWYFIPPDSELNRTYAYNNTALGIYIPRPDGGGGTSVPEANWAGLITNIDFNSAGSDTRINSDSGLYVAGDRWYYQANDCIGNCPPAGNQGIYEDDGWVELSWNITTTSVPEPATMLLLGLGLVGVGAASRKKRED